MNNSIIEIAQLITKEFEENFEKMIIEKKDISEFILEIKKMLDTAGSIGNNGFNGKKRCKEKTELAR